VVIALGVEAAARFGLDRSSKIQRRTVDEYRSARTIGLQPEPAGRHVLVVGNSLLDEGVDFDSLRQALDGWDARRFVVEQTYYYDWYYGLRRLFAEGARPDVVVLMLSTGQWVSTATRGDYSAQYLFSLTDLPAVARDLHLHPTQATGLFFAGVSKFWAARAEMRNFVLRYALPGIGEVMNQVAPVNRAAFSDTDVESTVGARVEQLKEVVESHGARLVLLVPPLLNAEDGAVGLMQAAERVNVAALRPVVSGSFGPQLYRDSGFHLNAKGASQFTERLAVALRGELEAPAARRAESRPGSPAVNFASASAQ
jgi:lysophospholipase L1-like esterase